MTTLNNNNTDKRIKIIKLKLLATGRFNTIELQPYIAIDSYYPVNINITVSNESESIKYAFKWSGPKKPTDDVIVHDILEDVDKNNLFSVITS